MSSGAMEACHYLANVTSNTVVNTANTKNFCLENLDSRPRTPLVFCNRVVNLRKKVHLSKTTPFRIDSITYLKPRVHISDVSFFRKSHLNGLRVEVGESHVREEETGEVRAGVEGEKPESPKARGGKIPLESRRPVAPIYIPPQNLPPVFVYDEYIPRKKPRQFPLYNSDEGPPALGGMGPNHKSGYVALIGRPNAGKSTLLNQLIGQKLSIVTEKPQTTRHRILGISSGRDYQMILYDTPGVMSHRMHKLDEVMMQNVRNAAVNADCIILVVDICVPPEQVVDMLQEAQAAAAETRPLLLVLNKKDRIKPGEVKNKLKWYTENSNAGDVMVVSAKYGQGCEEIRKWALSKLPLGPAYYPRDIVSEHPERFFVAEIVREKILLLYEKEIPYVSQVNVVTYIERDGKAKDFVELDIVVERESQKGILIGKDGNALKALATASRLEIEEFVGRPIFLEIRVKVKENWRQDEKLLQVYGLDSKLMQ